MSEAEGMNKQTPHGIPVKVVQPDGDVKTFMIASVRKCPELGGLIKNIDAIDVDGVEIENKLSIEGYKLRKLGQNDGETEDFAGLVAEVSKLSRELAELQEKKEDAVLAFFRKGFHAAGYTEDQVDELVLPCISVEMYGEIRSKCRLGCGWVDFTRQE